LIDASCAATKFTVAVAIAVEGTERVSDCTLLVIVASLSPVAANTVVGLRLWAAGRVDNVGEDLTPVDLYRSVRRRNNFCIRN